jgi:hypothetical protein
MMAKKKKIARDKKYRPDAMQVFDSCSMPHGFGEEELSILVAGDDGARNDSYWRWYPDKANNPDEVGRFCKFRDEAHQKAGKALNIWLVNHGMKWKTTDKYFHVLIHFNW